MNLQHKPVFLRCIAIASFLLFCAVAFGAFGAHALAKTFSEKQLANWHTAINYMVIHAFALIVIAALTVFLPEQIKIWRRAGQSFMLGTVLFSGSLYIWSLTLYTPVVFVTPIGGLLFLLGWGLVFWGVLKASKST